jgi:O-antigen/teichoic acid export membrane protein
LAPSNQAEDAVTAGRGFLQISSAKIYFILVSAFLALGLPRLLGDPGIFGRYRMVNAFVSILNMVMIVGTIQCVSKLVSEDERRAGSVTRVGLQVQLVAGGILAAAVALFAGPIAQLLFGDPSLALFLRVGAIVTFFYSIYAVFVGVLNGSRQFARQAGLDALFSTLKVGLIVALVIAGYGVLGAFSGFALAAAAITGVGAYVVVTHLPAGDAGIERKQLTTLLAPILATTLLINLLLQLDVLTIKGFVIADVESYLESNEGRQRVAWLFERLDPKAVVASLSPLAQESADRLAGLFGGAKNLALLPYQLTFAITFVVFPLVSNATYSNDWERARKTVRHAIRFALILAVLAAVVLASIGQNALALLLGAQYAAATPALLVLLIASVGGVLTVLGLTVLNSAGLEKRALGIAAFTVVVYLAALWLLLPTAPNLREGILLRTAQASLVAMIVGVFTVLWTMHGRFGTLCSWGMLIRVGLTAFAVIGLMQMWPSSTLFILILKALAAAVLFVLALVVTRELGRNDLDAVKRILGRGGS